MTINTPRRTVWISAGLAIAAICTASFVGASADAAIDDEATWVPITPCRLFDFRPAPDNVGPRVGAMGANETHTLQVTGANGDCIIPDGVTAISMNVTALNATAPSFLQLWPADAAQPARGSSLNYLPGSAPTPNKVDVKLAPDGKVKMYNLNGTVDVLGDVVGYYTDQGLNEIIESLATKAEITDVYTKLQTDALLAGKPDVTDVYGITETYTQEEVDAALAAVTAVTDDLEATKADITDVYDKDAIDATVTTINEAIATNTGGIANLNDALDLKANTTDVTALSDAIATNTGGIADLNDALDLKANTTDVTALSDAIATNTGAIADLNDALDLKANSSDVTTEIATAIANFYTVSQQEEKFMGRDPEVVMRQNTSTATGLLGSVPTVSVLGVTVLANTSTLLELVGPESITDEFGTTNYRLGVVKYCVADGVQSGVLLDTVFVTVRDELGAAVDTASGAVGVGEGCYSITLTTNPGGDNYVLQLNVGGPVLLDLALVLTSVRTTWVPITTTP